jgi:hypothetical protein
VVKLIRHSFIFCHDASVGLSMAAMNPGLSLAEVGQYLLSLGEQWAEVGLIHLEAT